MFPLGSVLLPAMVLPLHIFEPRYARLVEDCLAGDGTFGVCLIERGSEVGGGEVRTDVGTMARIVEAHLIGDRRWAVIAHGVRRIRVTEWMPDNPYPLARTEPWDDEQPATAEDLGEQLSSVAAQLDAIAALGSALGLSPEAQPAETDPDPQRATYQMTALSPLGPLDRQQLLESPSTSTRLDRLAAMLSDSEADLRAQLRMR